MGMRNAFVFNTKEVNEGKLRNEALARMRENPEDRTTIHLHGAGARCNGSCYLVKERVSDSEKRRGV